MKLEELLYSRISGAEYGSPGLASFDGAPAIFFGPCPEDTDRGWKDGRQYPRISYSLDLRGDPERQTAGTLYVDVWCTEDGPAPEDIEPVLRAVLCGVIMAPEGDNPCSFAWQTSQTFQSARETKTDKVIGVTVTFDMIAFPEQITSDPDPVLAMMKFIRDEYPEITVIGQNTLPDFTEPSEEHPAVYFRLDGYELGRETHTVAWLEGVVAATCSRRGPAPGNGGSGPLWITSRAGGRSSCWTRRPCSCGGSPQTTPWTPWPPGKSGLGPPGGF